MSHVQLSRTVSGHAVVVQQRSVEEDIESDNIRQTLQEERQNVQAKIFAKWLNYRLKEAPGSPQIENLFQDLRSGKLLIALLSTHMKRDKLRPDKGNMRVHHLNNLAKVFQVLDEEGIKTVGIHAESICDGQVTYTLGLCWSIIYYLQVLRYAKEEGENAEKLLLDWCREVAQHYEIKEVSNFNPYYWKSGYLLNALVHSFNPTLFQYHSIRDLEPGDRIEHAVDMATQHCRVPKLFTATDIENDLIDNKTLVLYVSMLKEKLDEERYKNQEMMEKLLGELERVRGIVVGLEGSDLVNPPATLSYADSKELSKKYKDFDQECNDLSSRILTVKDEGEGAERTQSMENFNADCDDLVKRVDSLIGRGQTSEKRVIERRISLVKGSLKNVIDEVAAMRTEMEILSEVITPESSRNSLTASESTCKDLYQKLAQMQQTVKVTCSTVDDAYSDTALPKTTRQELKSEAIKVLKAYANAMDSSKKLLDRASALLVVKIKNVEGRLTAWSDKVKDLDVWLAEREGKYDKMLIEYGTCEELKEMSTQNKQLMRGMSETWKTFEAVAQEWNGGLCDEMDDDQYADMLVDIQMKFTNLKGVADGNKKLIGGMLSQKKAEDELMADIESWMVYLEGKQEEIEGLPVDDPERCNAQMEVLVKEMKEKDEAVKVFLTGSSATLQTNKYDQKAVHHIEEKLKEFCELWDGLKESLNDVKKKVDHEEQTLLVHKESERNLTDSLVDWLKILDGFTSKLSSCDIDENSEVDAIARAINILEVLEVEIEEEDAHVKEYDRNSTTLINTLPHDISAHLHREFRTFFVRWDDMKEQRTSMLSRLISQYNKLMEEEMLMRDWNAKHMVTEEWLDNVTTEIDVYASPDDDDYEAYLTKLDELEDKVNAEVDVVDDSIALGRNLAEGDQLILNENKVLIKNVVDAFQTKKASLHENLLLAKSKMSELRDKKQLHMEIDSKVVSHLEQWKEKLQDNTDTVDRCELNVRSSVSDTQKAIDILSALIGEIDGSEGELKEFEMSSRDLISQLSLDKANKLNVELRLFLKSWDHCKDKASERLISLKVLTGQLQKNEGYLASEWCTMAMKTIAWLEDIEKESASFGTLPDDIAAMKMVVAKYEELSNKVTRRIDSVVEEKGNGVALVESGDVQLPENVSKIHGHIATFDEKLESVSANLMTAKKLIEEEVRANILKKLDDFTAWLPTVQKRSQEGDGILGPDFETINNQIPEMKVIQGQALQMSFSGILEDDNLLEFLTKEDVERLQFANKDWAVINGWVDKRLEVLENCEHVYEEFKGRKVDLIDYLREIENELNSSIRVDLNECEDVKERTGTFHKVTVRMESRKTNVADLVSLGEQLMDLISTEADPESSLSTGILSQVTDVLDLWNSTVKRSIELKTILQTTREQFETLEKMFKEVRDWLDNVTETLTTFTSDARGEYIDELRESLDKIQNEEEGMKEKLHQVNVIDERLSHNGELVLQYTLAGSVTELNEDFHAICTQLEQLRGWQGKARIWSRLVRGGTRRMTSSLFSSDEDQPPVGSVYYDNGEQTANVQVPVVETKS